MKYEYESKGSRVTVRGGGREASLEADVEEMVWRVRFTDSDLVHVYDDLSEAVWYAETLLAREA